MSYKHLSLSDREVIKKMIKKGYSQVFIADVLEFDKSTISRELERNKGRYWYQPNKAHEMYLGRRKNSKKRKIDIQPGLKALLLAYLEDGWSPDIISGRIKRVFGKRSKMNISHESIYLWIYQQGEMVYRLLPRGVPKRKRRNTAGKHRILIPERKNIHTRPPSVESKKWKGHWEGDTLFGSNKQGYLATMVERKTKYLAAALSPDKRPDSCNRAILEAFGSIPNSFIKTITLDNGTEFFNYKTLEEALECQIYFADPYSAWQRGTNEHTNGMLRRYFPKSTNFTILSQNEVDFVVSRLNNRPRKSLNYQTPCEAFYNLKVALQC